MDNKSETNNKKAITIFFTILAIIFSFTVVSKTFQNDTFFNITIGKYIAEHGIDLMDHFSYHENLEYTYSHWAFDVVIYFIYNLFGFRGIYLSILIFTGLTSAVIFNLISKKTGRPSIALFVTLVTIQFVGTNFTARSQIISFVCFFIIIYCIENFIDTNKIRYAITTILLSIVVANFHAATWPLILVLFMPYFAASLINLFRPKHFFIINANFALRKANKYKDNNEKKYEYYKKEFLDYTRLAGENQKEPVKITIKDSYNIKNLIILFVLVCFTGLVTPIHGVPYTYILKSMFGHSTLPYHAISYISEMQPLIPISQLSTLFFTGLLAISLLVPSTKIKVEHLFLIAGLYLMAFYSKRYFVLLYLIGAIVLADLYKQTFTLSFEEKGLDLLEKLCVSIPGIAILSLLVIIYSSISLAKESKKNYLNFDYCPVGAVDYIKNNLDYENIRLYNQYENGSFLMFNGIKVFIDSRLDVYCSEFSGRDIFKDYIEAEQGYTNYKEAFKNYDFTHLLIKQNSIISLYIKDDPDYKEIYSDDYYLLYESLK